MGGLTLDSETNQNKVRIVYEDGNGVDASVIIPKEGGRLSIGPHLNGLEPYHLIDGNVTASNLVNVNGFGTTLYSGTGAIQTITTDIDMVTQHGTDVSETYGGLIWGKSRSSDLGHYLIDTIRGSNNILQTNTTAASLIDSNTLSSFNNNGFSIGNGLGLNTLSATYTSWVFQTTHRRSGVTNHGKAYTEHYNPYSGFTIIKYDGSGLVGHEIPHSLGRKLGIVTVKNLTTASNWPVYVPEIQDDGYMYLNLQNVILGNSTVSHTNNGVIFNFTGNEGNASGNSYITYGWANSYYDNKNKLLGNYEIGRYNGTGQSGNKIITRGKPAWLMLKRLNDVLDGWLISDNIRGDKHINTNTSNVEVNPYDMVDFVENGFILKESSGQNAAGGQYLYMVVYDNDSASGKSRYQKPTSTTNLQLNSALIPFSEGVNYSGGVVSTITKNETITGLTLRQGKNYPYIRKDGTYGVNYYKPLYGWLINRTKPNENPDFFDLETRKWYSTIGGTELITNGTFDSNTNGWTPTNGATLAVSNGQMQISGGTANGAYTTVNLVAGVKYKLKYNIQLGTSTGARIVIGSTIGGSEVSYFTGLTTTSANEYTFTVNTSGVYYINAIQNSTNATTYSIDSVSLFELVPTIGAELSPMTYLDCIIYADHNNKIEYVEDLPKTNYFNNVSMQLFENAGTIVKDNGIEQLYADGTIVGINANGSYIKYPDGLAICQINKNVSVALPANSGTDVGVQTPIPYIPDYSKTTVSASGQPSVTWSGFSTNSYAKILTSTGFVILYTNGPTAQTLLSLQATLICRWK